MEFYAERAAENILFRNNTKTCAKVDVCVQKGKYYDERVLHCSWTHLKIRCGHFVTNSCEFLIGNTFRCNVYLTKLVEKQFLSIQYPYQLCKYKKIFLLLLDAQATAVYCRRLLHLC